MNKTENQIIQALKICRSDNSCTKCPYYSALSTTCMSQLASDAFNLIQKQREEITELTGKHWNECGQIARYSDELNQFADIGKMYSEIKAEIIKKFAEKLKANFAKLDYKTDTHRKTCDVDFCDKTVNWVIHDITSAEIDNLVKEMTGGEDNESR